MLLPAEIIELIELGYSNIICAQPFGCLPNHIVGKGVIRRLRELYPDVPESVAGDEKIIIEGVADCAFVENGELVIVDYKTDRVSSGGELKELYASQLGIYRRCLEQVIGLPVSHTLIYSFRLGETVEL